MGWIVHRAFYGGIAKLVFLCVGVPVAVLFAAYLVGIVVMCTSELRNMKKGAQSHEKTDPPL